MSTDPGAVLPAQGGPDLSHLPEVVDLRIRRRQLEPPRRVTTRGVDGLVAHAVELEVRVSEPFQVRALGPTLWVGDVPLTIADSDSDNVYRFLSFAPEALEPGAPISLAWSSSASPRRQTGYRYPDTVEPEKP